MHVAYFDKENNVTVESYTLKNEVGGWLAQVLLSSDGMFAAVSDWGNFAFSWRSIGKQTFKEFLMDLGVDYFESKMVSSVSYMATGKRVDSFCKNFARRVLPVLQKTLKEEAQAQLQREIKDGD
jgi:hypothetical protein